MLWLWNFFLDRRQLSYVLVTVLILAGSYSLLLIPKENIPPIVIAEGVVTTTLPGATAEDMETLVTDKLEPQIAGIANIDTITSDSVDGVSSIVVQFTASADINQSIQDLRDAVSRTVPNLPADANAPLVSKINFSNEPIMVASVSGNLTPLQFSTLGKTLSDDLTSIPGVSTVDVAGVPPREVDVIVSKESLAQYGLTLTGVISAISAANAALPAGSISMDNVNYNVNFQGGITDPSQIQNIAVGTKNNVPVYVRDIAMVSDGLAPPSTYSRLSLKGKPSDPAITLTVYRQSGADIQTTANAVKKELTKLQSATLAGLDLYVSPSTDQGVQINKQLGSLTQTGFETVLLVIAVLLLTIGWRESLVAAFAIPLSFLIAFIGLYLTGNTLNFISLFALILAVGILVDSGIVVTEAIHARMKIYGEPMAAARAALSDYAWPLIAGTMATVAVFAPLFFISGIIGKFIAGIPYTLIFVLIASIFVALGIVPLIAVLFTKRNPNRMEEKQEEYTTRFTNWYTAKLRVILEHRRYQNMFIWTLVGLFVLSLVLPFTGLVQTEFFPQSDEDYVYINIQKPEGTTLAATDLTAREVEEILYTDPDIASLQTTVGQSSALTGQASSGSNQANITVNLPDGHKKSSTQIADELTAKLAVVKDATVQVLQASSGPPSGAPIQIQLEGKNLNDLIAGADRASHLLATFSHVTNITTSTQSNGSEFDLTIDRAKAAAFGLNTQTVAQTLRAAVNGTKATTITLPSQNIDVVVKLDLNSANTDPNATTQATIDDVKNISIQGPTQSVLLGSILNDSLGAANADISHNDQNRIETVSAYPDSKTTTSAVIAEFQKHIGELQLPAGVSVSYGGETQSINQSFTQMFVAIIAGLVLMFIILILAFNSIRYSLYLLSIVPLSLIGVLDGLAFTGQPVSFTSLLGIIGLGGVIINHAIILMDSMIHHHRAQPGKPVIDIVVESSATRLRPIFLTTVTTVIGMIPLSMSNATWGPFAFAVMFGLTFAICLTLVLVPVLFFRAASKKPKVSA
jgi:multidrug efflux pump subunit AcrB